LTNTTSNEAKAKPDKWGNIFLFCTACFSFVVLFGQNLLNRHSSDAEITTHFLMVPYLLRIKRRFASPLTFTKITINDLLGGRGWWLVKGALVRGPFLFSAECCGFFISG